MATLKTFFNFAFCLLVLQFLHVLSLNCYDENILKKVCHVYETKNCHVIKATVKVK